MKLRSLHKDYSQLIKRAKNGNARAQQSIFQLFAPKMMSVCRQYLKSDVLAEEVMLNGFLKVFTKLEMYTSDGSFEGWIRRIMIHESLNELRRNKNLYFKDESAIENSLEYASEIKTELGVEEIQKMIDALPDGYRTVFVLYVVEGYKHSEISELLKISEGTSKSQLSKARSLLQEMLREQNKINYGTE